MANKPTQENTTGSKRPTGQLPTSNASEKQEKKQLKLAFSWSMLDRKRYYLALLLIVSISIGILLSPGLLSQSKTYDNSWLGQITTKDIRSPGDYNIVDLSATETKRQEAERAINPIYDHYTTLGKEIQQRIDLAFDKSQKMLYDFIIDNLVIAEEQEATSKKRHSRTNKKSNAKDTDVDEENAPAPEQIYIQRIERVKKNLEIYVAKISKDNSLKKALTDLLVGQHSDFNRTIHAVIPEEDYLLLANYSFADDLRNSLKRMVGDIMSRKIINDKELMERGGSEEITLRVLDDSGRLPTEYQLRDSGSILDYKEINQSLWRYTTILSDLGPRQRNLLLKIGGKLVQPTLTFNRDLTQSRRLAAREAVKPMIIPIKKREIIIRDGERFEKRHLMILKGIQREMASVNPIEVMVGYSLFFMVLISTLAIFARNNIRKFNPHMVDFLMMTLLILLFILMVKAVGIIAAALGPVLPNVDSNIFFLGIPVAAGAAMVRIVTNSETATYFAILTSILYSFFSANPFFMGIYALVTSLVAADSVGQCRTRTTLFFAGLRVSLVAMLLIIFMHLYSGRITNLEFLYALIAATASGIATGLVLTGITPLIEFLFGYTTDIKLLELSNLNHPLLKKLIVQAPGTYHHSILVGSLVEAAAESIHANPLLARVAAYYHDIGKIKTPHYFAENQRDGDNPHDTLSPSMSVLILQSHVKEGVELARQYNLGAIITDIIEQHHGTNLIRYFQHKASEMRKEGANVSDDERDFRYPGPKPQTREAGLVMLADATEAATRSLENSSKERIQGMVQKIINMIFRDGQLNECELTLKDLHLIARAFTQILVGLYHNRPSYPGQQKPQEKTPNGRTGSQQTKKAEDPPSDVEDDDDKDLRRLGMH